MGLFDWLFGTEANTPRVRAAPARAHDRGASFGADAARKLRNWAGPHPLAIFRGYAGFSPDSRILAILGARNQRQIDVEESIWTEDWLVELWDVEAGKCRNALEVGDRYSSGRVVGFSPDGTLLAVAHSNYRAQSYSRKTTVSLWRVRSGDRVGSLQSPTSADQDIPITIAFVPNGTIMAVAYDGSNDRDCRHFQYIQLWNVSGDRLITTFPARPDPNSIQDLGLAFDPTGKFLVVARSKRIELLELATGNCVGNYKANKGESVGKIWFDQWGRLLAGAQRRNRMFTEWYLRFWQVSSCGELVRPETWPVSAHCFTSDLKLIAIPVADGYSEVRDTATGTCTAKVAGVPVAFSPNNAMLVTYLGESFLGEKGSGYGLWAIAPY